MRNAMDAQEVAVGWWPGDARHAQAAFYAYAHPAREGLPDATLSPRRPVGRRLGEFVLDWDDVRAPADPPGPRSSSRRSVFRHACAVCAWDPALAASADAEPPPVR